MNKPKLNNHDVFGPASVQDEISVTFTEHDCQRLQEIADFFNGLRELLESLENEMGGGSIPVAALKGIVTPGANLAWDLWEEMRKRFPERGAPAR